MANVYVEARPKGRPEGTHIDDYVVEDRADHVLATFKTQVELRNDQPSATGCYRVQPSLPPRDS